MNQTALGKITGIDNCYRIETAITVAAPIEQVWETATSSETVGWWFAPGTIEAEGGRIELNYTDGKFGMEGDVKVLFRPHVFEFSWEATGHSDRTTIIRIDFVETDGGETRATLTSFVFDQLDTVYLVIATWRFMLERLAQAVIERSDIPDDEQRVAELIQEFRQFYEQG